MSIDLSKVIPAGSTVELSTFDRSHKPKVAPTDFSANIDVDDTLIFWEEGYDQPGKNKVEIVCPYDGKVTYHRVHQRHVEFVKKLKARGYTIVIWSSAGARWAEAVVNAIGLSEHADWIQTKPVKVLDDLTDPKEIIGNPFQLSEKGHSL